VLIEGPGIGQIDGYLQDDFSFSVDGTTFYNALTNTKLRASTIAVSAAALRLPRRHC
jgi:hypothetical protein